MKVPGGYPHWHGGSACREPGGAVDWCRQEGWSGGVVSSLPRTCLPTEALGEDELTQG